VVSYLRKGEQGNLRRGGRVVNAAGLKKKKSVAILFRSIELDPN
jgi:hypothetical protein